MVLDGEAVKVYRAMGEEAGRLRVERVTGGIDGGGWMVRETVEMESGRPRVRELMLERLGDGSIALRREVNRGERVIVDFEPSLVIYPAKLTPGETFEQNVRMTVHPISDPERVQTQGDATQRITWEGGERIATPTGERECVKLVAVFEADLGGPQVVNETQEWLADGAGVVAMKKMERTTLLGVRVRANSEWWGENGK